MTPSRLVVPSLVAVLLLVGLLPAGASAAPAPSVSPSLSVAPVPSGALAKRSLPTYDEWLADVKDALRGARPYVRARVAAAGADEVLAVNFDVDNTVLATTYQPGHAIPPVARFVRYLHKRGVLVVFNTARPRDQRAKTIAVLKAAGYPIDGICLGTPGLTIPAGKQRCRDVYAKRGYTLIANVGNNTTDFLGDGYDRAIRLPNYGGQLG
jgi:hypothetical protein